MSFPVACWFTASDDRAKSPLVVNSRPAPYRVVLRYQNEHRGIRVPRQAKDRVLTCLALPSAAMPMAVWKVLAPVMLEIDGRLLGPMVGTILEPGTATNGIPMSEVVELSRRPAYVGHG
jgi:hypothetical protein